MNVLHLSPHPDDEVLGAGAGLLALKASGHRVMNLAVSLGRREDQERRLGEVREACARMDIDLLLPQSPYLISKGDDLRTAEENLVMEISGLIGHLRVDLIVSPSPHDGHHGHELVGRAAREACMRTGLADWWMWGLWADLPFANLLCPFGQETIDTMQHALAAHAGEIGRNDYSKLLTERSSANSILGPERVWGYGADGINQPYAELLCAVRWQQSQWHLLTPSALTGESPLIGEVGQEIGWWISQPSLSDRLRSESQSDA